MNVEKDPEAVSVAKVPGKVTLLKDLKENQSTISANYLRKLKRFTENVAELGLKQVSAGKKSSSTSKMFLTFMRTEHGYVKVVLLISET